MTFVLGVVVSLLIVAGQLLWRAAVRDARIGSAPEGLGHSVVALMFSPRMLAGIFLYVVAAGLYLYMQARYEYHLVQAIVVCGSLLLSFVSAAWLLNEKVTIVDVGALALIVVAVALIGRHS